MASYSNKPLKNLVTNNPNKFWMTDSPEVKKSPPTIEYTRRYNEDADQMIYLGLNENVKEPNLLIQEAVLTATKTINRYPDNHFTKLSYAVAEETGIHPTQQIWGAGASDLINRVVSINARAGLKIISPAPTFWGYERSYEIINADVERVGLRSDGHTDVDAMLEKISDDTGVITFSTPANPSGIAVPEADIISFAKNTPEHILLLIDEVYFEYAKFDGEPDMIELMHKYRPNGKWLILRSFSKAYGLAGARIGYGLASDKYVAARVENDYLNFSVSSFAFSAALSAYLDKSSLTETLNKNGKQRDKLEKALQSLKLAYYPSSANFISIIMPQRASYYIKKLYEQKIICASWNDENFPYMLRVAITNEVEGNKFIEALTKTLKS
uniref:Aminotransferase n=1 Tax=OCS116 cluster bacterium TaxID=2030921 RepID=A0A2A4YZ88_9PROT